MLLAIQSSEIVCFLRNNFNAYCCRSFGAHGNFEGHFVIFLDVVNQALCVNEDTFLRFDVFDEPVAFAVIKKVTRPLRIVSFC